MVIKYLIHIYEQLIHSICPVVVQCLTGQLLNKCITGNVQELEENMDDGVRRYE